MHLKNVGFQLILFLSFIYDKCVSYGKGAQLYLAIQLFLVCVFVTFLLRKI